MKIKLEISKLITYFTMLLLLFTACKEKTGKSDEKTVQIKSQKAEFRIGAYNVEFGNKGTAEQIGKMLRTFDLQVVCMSEVPGGNWAKEVGKEMGMEYIVLGRYSTAGHEDKYKAILSKTPLHGQEEVLMADTLHTVVKAKTEINGKEISIYSVHFPFGWRDQAHIDETDNKVKSFVDYLKEHRSEELAVLAGDFNFIPTSSTEKSKYHELFKGLGFQLSGEPVGMPYDSLNSMVGKDRKPGRVIDHIFFDPGQMRVLESKIIELDQPLSDHKPVMSVLEFK